MLVSVGVLVCSGHAQVVVVQLLRVLLLLVLIKLHLHTLHLVQQCVIVIVGDWIVPIAERRTVELLVRQALISIGRLLLTALSVWRVTIAVLINCLDDVSLIPIESCSSVSHLWRLLLIGVRLSQVHTRIVCVW